jgi:hypothetical protein
MNSAAELQGTSSIIGFTQTMQLFAAVSKKLLKRASLFYCRDLIFGNLCTWESFSIRSIKIAQTEHLCTAVPKKL